jgi:putative nucleotidyltransferase with HDIG domain
MQYLKTRILRLLFDFFGEDDRRITHAMAVLEETEKLMPSASGADEEILVACALLHDVGIKPSEAELGYNNGKTQEKYGPEAAETLLKRIGFPEEKIRKVKEIIGNHHSPPRYDYIELKILRQADKTINRGGGR